MHYIAYLADHSYCVFYHIARDIGGTDRAIFQQQDDETVVFIQQLHDQRQHE